MSRRPPQQAEQRIRELARQYPGWTPSQLAIFLQGEKLKVTSEDVRRVLARPTAGGQDPGAAEAQQPRYTAPRQARARSSVPVGVLFGVLLFVYYFGVQLLSPTVGPNLSRLMTALGTALLLLMAGAVASHRLANGARAGALAALLNILLTAGLAALVYTAFRPQLQAITGQALPATLTGGDLRGLAFGIALLLVFFGMVGALLGWLGAKLFGRRRRRATFG